MKNKNKLTQKNQSCWGNTEIIQSKMNHNDIMKERVDTECQITCNTKERKKI